MGIGISVFGVTTAVYDSGRCVAFVIQIRTIAFEKELRAVEIVYTVKDYMGAFLALVIGGGSSLCGLWNCHCIYLPCKYFLPKDQTLFV